MIKLKKILVENKLPEIKNMLSGYIIPKIPVYRVDKEKTHDMVIGTVRKDRKPLDTHPFAEAIFEYFRRNKYPDIPSRRSSLYMTTSMDYVTDYEERDSDVSLYFCFVKKGITVWHFPDDSINDTNNGFTNSFQPSSITWLTHDEKDEKAVREAKYINQLFDLIIQTGTPKDYKKIYRDKFPYDSFLDKYWDNIITEANEFMKKTTSDRFKIYLERLLGIEGACDYYFKKFKKIDLVTYETESHNNNGYDEIIAETDNYLLVNAYNYKFKDLTS